MAQYAADVKDYLTSKLYQECTSAMLALERERTTRKGKRERDREQEREWKGCEHSGAQRASLSLIECFVIRELRHKDKLALHNDQQQSEF